MYQNHTITYSISPHAKKTTYRKPRVLVIYLQELQLCNAVQIRFNILHLFLKRIPLVVVHAICPFVRTSSCCS